METKQVIVMRKDLRNFKGEKIRTGKFIAQVSHASIGALLLTPKLILVGALILPKFISDRINHPVIRWLNNSFTKITVSVNSETALIEVYEKALALGLAAKLITDAGRTEFNGHPTVTCLAIGPDYSDKIDQVTYNLPLL